MASALYFQLFLTILTPALADIGMKFKKYPQSVAAPVGDEVAFECVVNVPGDRLAWRWRPVDDARWREANGTTDKTSTRLVITVREDTPVSLYQCVVWYGAVSLVSIPARLSIARMDLSGLSPNTRVLSAPPHNVLVINCREPVSEPPAVITWWKEYRGSKRPLETPQGVLVIHNATAEDSGTYGCSATNEPSGKTVDLPEKVFVKVERGKGEVKFLESEDYVGTIDNEGVLTVSVKPKEALRLWCGVVGSPPPRVTWTRQKGAPLRGKHNHTLVIDPFTPDDEDVYSCVSNGIRRSWKVIALQAPYWEGSATNANATEGGEAHVTCGVAHGQPPPTVTWLLNSEPIQSAKTNKTTISESELYIFPAQKRHAGVVQCFACSALGCAYDAALLTVVPVQIADDRDYSAEVPKTPHSPFQTNKRPYRKNKGKHKVIMIPPSKPNVTRLSDTTVMVSWTHPNHGLPIQFYKVQYKEVSNMSDMSWQTGIWDILPHIHACEVDALHPNVFYKFRIAAVYSNQDNKQGKSSGRFYLQRGVSSVPRAPELTKAKPLSPHSVQLNWTWSSGPDGVQAEGFYVYFRALTSAGLYDKAAVSGGGARGVVLAHLTHDTAYELKIRAYTTHAASDFSSIKDVKTLRPTNAPTTTTEAPVEDMKGSQRAPDPLVTAGGALGAVALLVLLAVILLLCRRAKRPPAHKEKGSVPESGGGNGYIQAKVPMTITSNPMHAEGGDGGVEMSFLHNNNCGNAGNNDDTLPHSRKNGPTTRQYV